MFMISTKVKLKVAELVKRGTGLIPKKKSNIDKIKETFGPKVSAKRYLWKKASKYNRNAICKSRNRLVNGILIQHKQIEWR